MISYREERLLQEVGMSAVSEVIYPLMATQAPCQTRNRPAFCQSVRMLSTHIPYRSLQTTMLFLSLLPEFRRLYEIKVARQANMRSKFPYCCSPKKALAAYNYKKSISAGGLTVLAVAHRLTSIREADKIVMLEQGRVVERGSHAELTALDGLYAELWRRQASERFSSGEGL